MHTTHFALQPLTSVQEYVVRLWVWTLLRTWSYHPPLPKPQSSKQGLCYLFLYSRHKRAADTDNNFTHVPLCKWRWWNKSKFCACTFYRWQSKMSYALLYILQLFSGFIAILLWECVCACMWAAPPRPCFCVPDFDSTCFRLVPNVDSGKWLGMQTKAEGHFINSKF